MKNYKKTAIVFLLIPIAVAITAVLSGIVASVLEFPTNRGSIYTLFAFYSILCIFFSHLPCLIVSAIGTGFAVKAKKEGNSKTAFLIVLGIFEIVISIGLWIYTWYCLIVNGASV